MKRNWRAILSGHIKINLLVMGTQHARISTAFIRCSLMAVLVPPHHLNYTAQVYILR